MGKYDWAPGDEEIYELYEQGSRIHTDIYNGKGEDVSRWLDVVAVCGRPFNKSDWFAIGYALAKLQERRPMEDQAEPLRKIVREREQNLGLVDLMAMQRSAS